MDSWAIAALVGNILLKYSPQLIVLAHQIAHDLIQHPDDSVRRAAGELHDALHNNPPPVPLPQRRAADAGAAP